MTAAEELAALLAVLREGGASVYVGPIPGHHWGFERTVPMSVRLELSSRPVLLADEPAPAKEETAGKPDPIAALEKRLFGVSGA